MEQSSYIAAALIIAFIVFITMRGELSQYLQVLGLAPAGQNFTPTNTQAAQRSVTL